jgi:hypothetical protein
VTLYDHTFWHTTTKLTDQGDVQSGRLVLSYKADIFGSDATPLK